MLVLAAHAINHFPAGFTPWFIVVICVNILHDQYYLLSLPDNSDNAGFQKDTVGGIYSGHLLKFSKKPFARQRLVVKNSGSKSPTRTDTVIAVVISGKRTSKVIPC